jgi:hypothetical protein
MPCVCDCSAARLKSVHAAIMHAWQGYKDYAWGEDELSPISKQGQKVRAPSNIYHTTSSSACLRKCPSIAVR